MGQFAVAHSGLNEAFFDERSANMNAMPNPVVTLYTTQFCPYCMRAKSLLEAKGVAFAEIAVDGDAGKRAEMMQRSGRRTVPQIWIGECHVGGFDDLWALEQEGSLDTLIEGAAAAP